MSDYLKLIELRKEALFEGDEDQAQVYWEMIENLIENGKVTEEEFIVGDYV